MELVGRPEVVPLLLPGSMHVVVAAVFPNLAPASAGQAGVAQATPHCALVSCVASRGDSAQIRAGELATGQNSRIDEADRAIRDAPAPMSAALRLTRRPALQQRTGYQ